MGREKIFPKETVFLRKGSNTRLTNRCPAVMVPDHREPLWKHYTAMTPRWCSHYRGSLGAFEAGNCLTQAASDPVREVFLEEVTFTLRPEHEQD